VSSLRSLPDHIIKNTVFLARFGGHHVTSLRILLDPLDRLPGVQVSLLNIRYVLWTLRLRVQRLIPFSGRTSALFVALLASLRVTIRSRLELAAEILALRHQVAV
jgi:hypothetical protein